MIQQAGGCPGGFEHFGEPPIDPVNRAQPWEMVKVRRAQRSACRGSGCAGWKLRGSLGTSMSRLILVQIPNTGPNPRLGSVLPAAPINTPLLTSH